MSKTIFYDVYVPGESRNKPVKGYNNDEVIKLCIYLVEQFKIKQKVYIQDPIDISVKLILPAFLNSLFYGQ